MGLTVLLKAGGSCFFAVATLSHGRGRTQRLADAMVHKKGVCSILRLDMPLHSSCVVLPQPWGLPALALRQGAE